MINRKWWKQKNNYNENNDHNEIDSGDHHETEIHEMDSGDHHETDINTNDDHETYQAKEITKTHVMTNGYIATIFNEAADNEYTETAYEITAEDKGVDTKAAGFDAPTIRHAAWSR